MTRPAVRCQVPSTILRPLLAALALVLPLVVAKTAVAQALPLIPAPITTREVADAAEILGLSAQQQLAILPMHDRYKERYRQFRERDVKKLENTLMDLFQEMRNRFVEGGFTVWIPERERLESILAQYLQILEGAQRIDESFYSEMSGLLTEAQLPSLVQARHARLLSMYDEVVTGMIGELNPGVRPNLNQYARELDTAGPNQEQIDILLAQYESNLLGKIRETHSQMVQAARVALDFVDSSGLRGMGPEDFMELEENEGFLFSVAELYNEASKPLQSLAHEISQLNLRTYRQIAPLLSETEREKLRRRFYSRAYDDLWHAGPEWRETYARALSLDGLAPEMEQAIIAQRDSFVMQEDQLVEQGVDLLEAAREYRTFQEMAEEETDLEMNRAREVVTRKQALAERAAETLNGLLTPDLLAKLNDEVVAEDSAHQTTVTISAGTGGVTVTSEVAVAAAESGEGGEEYVQDHRLPAPIDRRRVDRIADSLGFDEVTREILVTLFEQYEADRRTVLIKPDDAPKNDEAADQPQYTLFLQGVIERLNEVDTAFFQDIGALAPAEARATVERHRLLREREVANVLATHLGAWSFTEEPRVDIVRLLIEDAREVEVAPIAQPLEQYSREATDLSRERLEKAWELEKRRQSMQLYWQRMREQGEAPSEAIQQRWQEMQESISAMNQRFLDLNRRSLEVLTEALDEEGAWLLRQAYYEQAYPDIYGDAPPAQKFLDAVAGFADLSEHQQGAVRQITEEYRRAYFDLSEEMISLRRQDNRAGGGYMMPDRQTIEREIALERLKFDRREAADRAKLRLRLLLTADQLARLPDLALNRGD